MIGLLLKGLTGAAAPWVAGGLALVLASGWAFGGVQAVRLASAHKATAAVIKERDAALTNLGRCQANAASLESSIASQNAALDAWNTDGARRLADAGKAVTDAQRGRSEAEKRAAALIAAPPAGIDACARMMAADEAVLRSLQ